MPRVALPPFADLAEEFEMDGALRDIYVVGATVEDWQKVLDELRDCTPTVLVNDVPADVPLLAEVIARRAGPQRIAVQYYCEPLDLMLHFWGDDAAEFSFWPDAIGDEAGLAALLDFMRRLGRAVGKPVLVTPENSEEVPILEYDPATGDVYYHRLEDEAAV